MIPRQHQAPVEGNSRKLFFRFLAVLMLMATSTHADEGIEGLVVVALSPLDESAVVRLADQSMQVLRPGDTLRGTGLVLTQVLTDKLLLEDRADKSRPNRVVWLHKAVGGVSAVEYPELPKR